MTTTSKTLGAQDVYVSTTDAIVRAIEEGAGDWSMPWLVDGLAFPSNPTTGKSYRGGNVPTLWMSAMDQGFESGEWATYKQWESAGAQVRKGERGTGALLFTPAAPKETTDDDQDEKDGKQWRGGFARRFVVFNAAQVDGHEAKVVERDTVEQIEHAEDFFGAISADVEYRNEGKAYYQPSSDRVVLPPLADFVDAPSFYGTLAHELAHWTGHESRLARKYGDRFGDEAYAVEELTAELSAAFTCAILGISPAPRPDHAAYLASWLKVLKADTRALHSIASKAQAATDHLVKAAGRAPGSIIHAAEPVAA